MSSVPAEARETPAVAGAAFSLHETNALKGIAILGIAFHNFFHRVPNIVQENEFEFDAARFPLFLEQVFAPATVVQALFSFFGHYGVGVFVALSAYGLARSSVAGGAGRRIDFLATRVRKIMPMILLCIAIWLLLQLRSHSLADAGYWRATLLEVVLLCTGLFNLIPGLPLPAVGPWWFVPFILQFYLLWALAGPWLMRWPAWALLALSALGLLGVHLFNDRLVADFRFNLLETPIGHVPEIVMGILLTRFKPAAFAGWLLPLGALLVLGNAFELAWPLGSACATAILLIAFDRTRHRLPGLLRTLAWIGALSLPIFMLNGFVRRPFLALSASSGWAGADILWSLLSVGASGVMAWLLARLLEMLRLRRMALSTSGR